MRTTYIALLALLIVCLAASCRSDDGLFVPVIEEEEPTDDVEMIDTLPSNTFRLPDLVNNTSFVDVTFNHAYLFTYPERGTIPFTHRLVFTDVDVARDGDLYGTAGIAAEYIFHSETASPYGVYTGSPYNDGNGPRPEIGGFSSAGFSNNLTFFNRRLHGIPGWTARYGEITLAETEPGVKIIVNFKTHSGDRAPNKWGSYEGEVIPMSPQSIIGEIAPEDFPAANQLSTRRIDSRSITNAYLHTRTSDGLALLTLTTTPATIVDGRIVGTGEAALVSFQNRGPLASGIYFRNDYAQSPYFSRVYSPGNNIAASYCRDFNFEENANSSCESNMSSGFVAVQLFGDSIAVNILYQGEYNNDSLKASYTGFVERYEF